ncbi:DnaN DNA polymerase sliding clamp subunit (PCNA homolog) [uncultured Caudovirales phage]|uniref:DnaN DNA polymerase sliding clamp subunit (PCNA homolog) n=1 Tax=uncultured Caudovirales phage TaxID=2100421 RepID=A0A6J5MD80_9CAUD|nr:DnaN DNA polymerase sliding clamp subunit (PCNA homolog) [uncultured Caudovirales phage]
MKFSAPRDALAYVVNTAAAAAERKSAVEILKAVLLVAEPGRVTATGTDMDIEVTASIPANVTTPGTVAVEAATLDGFLKRLTGDAEVEAELTDALSLKAGRSRSRLAVLPAHEAPNRREVEGAPATVPGLILSRLLSGALPFTARENSRAVFTGVCLHARGDELRSCATDGNRLALLREGGPDKVDNALAWPGVILPPEAAAMLSRVFGSVDLVKVYASRIMLAVEGNDVRVVTKLIEGQFPDYDRIIPRDSAIKTTMRVDAAALAGAVDRALVVTDSVSSRVKINISPGAVTVSASAMGSETEDVIDAHAEGDAATVLFNGRFVASALKTIGGTAEARFQGARGLSVWKSPDGDEATFVIAPQAPSEA